MGCPAKKVCNVWSGSALLQDEPLVARISPAVVDAVDVPVTLKIRTGWDRENTQRLRIARIAEDSGIAALAVHGRTRADLYNGDAEYDTIAAVKPQCAFRCSPTATSTRRRQARDVLDIHRCRRADDRPRRAGPAVDLPRDRALPRHRRTARGAGAAGSRRQSCSAISKQLYAFYGENAGVRIARKHLGWYLRSVEKCGPDGRFEFAQASASTAPDRAGNAAFRAIVNQAETAREQLRLTRDYFAAPATDWPLAA